MAFETQTHKPDDEATSNEAEAASGYGTTTV